MDNQILFYITVGLLLLGLYIVYLKRSNETFHATIIDKDEETFTVMGSANKATSRTIIFLKDNGASVSVTVMNPAKYEKMKIGDSGIVTVKGSLLVEFKKIDNTKEEQ
ncbi:DUF2500 family protein [Paenibacillus guangzhouensis]|uniref:DUF2500 family protein n=1 Tax=Paenibacillus guangzhouensis TaxID=1473112 RepID=UPI001266D3C0|nr:DUF2500 family protein [Paenibacillus guangzhouensis]